MYSRQHESFAIYFMPEQGYLLLHVSEAFTAKCGGQNSFNSGQRWKKLVLVMCVVKRQVSADI